MYFLCVYSKWCVYGWPTLCICIRTIVSHRGWLLSWWWKTWLACLYGFCNGELEVALHRSKCTSKSTYQTLKGAQGYINLFLHIMLSPLSCVFPHRSLWCPIPTCAFKLCSCSYLYLYNVEVGSLSYLFIVNNKWLMFNAFFCFSSQSCWLT